MLESCHGLQGDVIPNISAWTLEYISFCFALLYGQGLMTLTQALDNIQEPTFHLQKCSGGSVRVLQAHPCVSLQCFCLAQSWKTAPKSCFCQSAISASMQAWGGDREGSLPWQRVSVTKLIGLNSLMAVFRLLELIVKNAYRLATKSQL